jgi:hypothetical protein
LSCFSVFHGGWDRSLLPYPFHFFVHNEPLSQTHSVYYQCNWWIVFILSKKHMNANGLSQSVTSPWYNNPDFQFPPQSEDMKRTKIYSVRTADPFKTELWEDLCKIAYNRLGVHEPPIPCCMKRDPYRALFDWMSASFNYNAPENVYKYPVNRQRQSLRCAQWNTSHKHIRDLVTPLYSRVKQIFVSRCQV